MALKWLQSAVYPRAEPKLQRGLTAAEADADYRRLERFVEEVYAPDKKGSQNLGRYEKGVRPKKGH